LELKPILKVPKKISLILIEWSKDFPLGPSNSKFSNLPKIFKRFPRNFLINKKLSNNFQKGFKIVLDTYKAQTQLTGLFQKF